MTAALQRLFERCLGLIVAMSLAMRLADVTLFYGERAEGGLVASRVLDEILTPAPRWGVLTLFPSATAAWALHLAMLIGCLALAAGFPRRSRLARAGMYLGLWVSALSFQNRDPLVSFGIDFISMNYFFYLFVVHAVPARLSGVGWALLRLQFCVIYFFSGVHKLASPNWWNGNAVWLATTGPYGRYELARVAQLFPAVEVLFKVGTWATLIFELGFPLLVWNRHTRPAWLILGAMMHAAIAFFIPIPTFALLMVSTYLVFLSDNEGAKCLKLLDRVFSATLTKRFSRID